MLYNRNKLQGKLKIQNDLKIIGILNYIISLYIVHTQTTLKKVYIYLHFNDYRLMI